MNKTVRRGSTGPAVVKWQEILIGAGYSLHPYRADGQFGQCTVTATVQWQTIKGLSIDGVVGPRTWGAALEFLLLSVFRECGIDVVDRSVPPRPDQTFRPIGIMMHHTASGSDSAQVLRRGRPGLPGPLAPVLIARDGTVTVICGVGGVCNHAGPGRGGVLEAVRNRRPLTSADTAWGMPDDTAGNAFFYGIEIENTGTGEVYTAECMASARRVVTALLEHHRWDVAAVIGHSEWTRRKIDPSFDMTEFRGSL